jgi:hypothetical protein
MHGNRNYLVPIDTADGSSPAEGPRGVYTLIATHTYRFIAPSMDTAFAGIHLTGVDAALVITSATVQSCSHAGPVANGPTTGDVPDTSVIDGEWINERPPSGYVGCDGTGWSVGSGATAWVVAAVGSGRGGAHWHIAETGAYRIGLLLVVGATGGKARVSGTGK